MAAAAGGYLYHRASPISLIQLGLILIAAGPGLSAFAESVNEIADLSIDVRASGAKVGGLRLSSGTGVLASGKLPRRLANLLVGGTAILGMLAAGLSSLSSLVIYSLGLALASAYSLNPVRLKERSFLGMTAQALGYGPVAVLLGQSSFDLSNGLLGRAILVGLWIASAGLTADLLDYQSDRSARVTTVPVYLGRAGGTYFLLAISALVFCSAMILQVDRTSIFINGFALILYLLWAIPVWRSRSKNLPASVHLFTLVTEIAFPFFVLS